MLNSPRDFGGSVTSCSNITVRDASLQLFEAHQKHNESKPEISCQHPPKGHEPTPTITVTAATLSQYKPLVALWRRHRASATLAQSKLISSCWKEPVDLRSTITWTYFGGRKKIKEYYGLEWSQKSTVHQYKNFGQQRFGSQQFTKLDSMPLWGGLCFINPHFSTKKFRTIFLPAMLGHWRVSSIIMETGWAEHLQKTARQTWVRPNASSSLRAKQVCKMLSKVPLWSGWCPNKMFISSFLLFPHQVGTHASHGVMRLGMVRKNQPELK